MTFCTHYMRQTDSFTFKSLNSLSIFTTVITAAIIAVSILVVSIIIIVQ